MPVDLKIGNEEFVIEKEIHPENIKSGQTIRFGVGVDTWDYGVDLAISVDEARQLINALENVIQEIEHGR
jgi:hypothetical protein